MEAVALCGRGAGEDGRGAGGERRREAEGARERGSMLVSAAGGVLAETHEMG